MPRHIAVKLQNAKAKRFEIDTENNKSPTKIKAKDIRMKGYSEQKT